MITYQNQLQKNQKNKDGIVYRYWKENNKRKEKERKEKENKKQKKINQIEKWGFRVQEYRQGTGDDDAVSASMNTCNGTYCTGMCVSVLLIG